MCIKERWSKREIERQLNSSLFERYMLADKPEKVTALIKKRESRELASHFKDEYVLEFLDLRGDYSEQELEGAILDNLRDFFLEFGKSFAFIGSQYVIDIGERENRIDLLFYHRELRQPLFLYGRVCRRESSCPHPFFCVVLILCHLHLKVMRFLALYLLNLIFFLFFFPQHIAVAIRPQFKEQIRW